MSEQSPVLFEERPSGNNKKIAIATLNAEKALNSLNLQMIDLLQEKFTAWEQDDSIACVFLQGAGDKAFCAGGDVVSLHNGAAAYGETLDNSLAEEFFTREYILDHHIHTYTKPVIVWGHGIVMGGGLGLMSGASHRVVTETTRMAMPEVTIGLYPDVGGTFFLNHAPGKTGLFLGLTGASFNGADAKFVGMGDRFVPHAEKENLLAALCDTAWDDIAEGTENTNYGMVTHVLRAFEQTNIDQQPAGQVHERLDWINDICDADNTAELVDHIVSYAGEDPWINKAIKGLANGCPVTPYLVVEQLRRGKHLSLADIFRMELTMSVNCVTRGHFKEGVRALLIDKDRNPQWTPSRVADVERAEIDAFFDEPWSQHPLASL